MKKLYAVLDFNPTNQTEIRYVYHHIEEARLKCEELNNYWRDISDPKLILIVELPVVY